MGANTSRTHDWTEGNDDRDQPRIEKIRRPAGKRRGRPERKTPRSVRNPEEDTFRCRNCRAMVGPTVSGGRHRNHCPWCLYSLHVDGPVPGDRASDCGARMAPVGLFTRPSGEQVILHRCLGCGFERYNRVAADDHPLVLMKLPLIEPRRARPDAADEAAGA